MHHNWPVAQGHESEHKKYCTNSEGLIMFRRAFSWSQTEKFIQIRGIMNSDDYIKVLDDN
mgnify:CR=1 FL=1